MGLFKKSKKKSNCCTLQIEEVKENKKEKSTCCDVKIEEVKDEKEASNK